jgi:hypothetical protein
MKTILKSKKFLSSVAAILFVLSPASAGLDEATILQVVSLVAAYIVGQGIADNGKEAARVHVQSKSKDQ